MADILFEQWREQNRDRRYPFADDAGMYNGTDRIPTYSIVDAALYPIGHTGNLFLSRVTRSASRVELAVSDGETGELATGSYTIGSTPDLLQLTDSYGRYAGVLVIDDPTPVFDGWALGDHLFTLDQTSFVNRVQIPMPQTGVRGFLLPDGTVVSGDVWLVGENGVRLIYEDGAIRVDVIGDATAKIRNCHAQDPETASAIALRQPLRTINGIVPDEFGNFSLTVGGQQSDTQVLRLSLLANGMQIHGAK